MFDYFTRLRHVAISAMIILVSAQQASALPGKNLVPSQLQDMPRWPLYVAGLVALVIAAAKTVQYVQGSQPKAKVFPKLKLRRRLYAPYSGGNNAEIGFGNTDA